MSDVVFPPGLGAAEEKLRRGQALNPTNREGPDPRVGGRGQAGGAPPLRGVRPVILLAGVLMTVGALRLGHEFLVPLAVAGLLTFILNPIVRLFERLLPRAVAVLLVVILTGAVLGALTWALALQAASLAEEIPTYRDNVKRKITEIRGVSRGGVIEKVQSATKEVVEEFQKEVKPVKPAEKPMPVVVKQQPSALWQLPALLQAFGNVGFVLVLVVFMLLERLLLRDRMIRVIGFGRIATTTKAMDEAGRRITNYLTRQTLVNGSFGLGVTLGALLIGLPYAFLWGFLAAVLRFIPYVGSWAAALIVSLVGLAVFNGWLQPALVVSLFITLELFTSFVLETYLYSQTAGVSQVGLLVAVAFWTWVWGPIGLALATPLTVCLVVLAKHVPDLEIVSVLMSDEPVMGTARSYYQRLIARDGDEAKSLVQDYVTSHPGHGVFDDVLVPALNHAQRDHARDRITDVEARFVAQTTRQLVEELELPQPPVEAAHRPATPILGLPAHEEADEIALLMLGQLLDPSRFTLDVASPDLLVSDVIHVVETRAPAIVLVGTLAGAGNALHLRYLGKRLRARFPNLAIVLGWWGAEGGNQTAHDAMVMAGADRVTVTLADASAQLQELASLQRAPDLAGTR